MTLLDNLSKNAEKRLAQIIERKTRKRSINTQFESGATFVVPRAIEPGSGADTLGSLDDVTITSVQDLQGIKWDAATEMWINSSDFLINPVNHIEWNTSPSGVPSQKGILSWNDTDLTLDLQDGVTVQQIGQESYVIGHNDTGGDIDDGEVVFVTGATGSRPTIQLAKADVFSTVTGVLGVCTQDITNGNEGKVTILGLVRGIDTSGFSAGDVLYVSSSTAGALVNSHPTYPNYTVQIGQCTVSDVSDGIICVNVIGVPEDILHNTWNGSFIEPIDFLIEVVGGDIIGSLDQTDGGNLTMHFSDGFTTLDTTPPEEIILTAGADDNPQKQFIYIPKSTKTLTLSTAGFPSTEHIKVSTVVLRTAATTNTDGALGNRNWNDHVASTNLQGHILDIGERIRQAPAQWDNGIEGTLTVGGGGSTLDVDTTAGKVYQLHKQIFVARNTATGDDLHIVNNFAAPYFTTPNLETQTTDASNNSLINSSFSFVLWGIINKTGETSHLMINLPTDTYGRLQPDDAVEDANNFAVYDIPDIFRGTGFLIARFTFQLTAGSSWTLYDTEDLRGKFPNTTAGGGGAGGAGVTTFLGLTDVPNSYAGEQFKFPQINSGETALEFNDLPVASVTVQGISELATAAEVLVGDDTGRTMTPSGIPIGNAGDLWVGGGGGTNAVKSKGTDGFVLISNSAASNEIDWVAENGVKQTWNIGHKVQKVLGISATDQLDVNNEFVALAGGPSSTWTLSSSYNFGSNFVAASHAIFTMPYFMDSDGPGWVDGSGVALWDNFMRELDFIDITVRMKVTTQAQMTGVRIGFCEIGGGNTQSTVVVPQTTWTEHTYSGSTASGYSNNLTWFVEANQNTIVGIFNDPTWALDIEFVSVVQRRF